MALRKTEEQLRLELEILTKNRGMADEQIRQIEKQMVKRHEENVKWDKMARENAMANLELPANGNIGPEPPKSRMAEHELWTEMRERLDTIERGNYSDRYGDRARLFRKEVATRALQRVRSGDIRGLVIFERLGIRTRLDGPNHIRNQVFYSSNNKWDPLPLLKFLYGED